ncbi:recombinase RecT [Caenibius sp. WL]|uniref:recombinase RecT n=1 Tax=Caenibius sp. WL TaxID=2872646 RepID=UPI001C99D8FE|nr:recombinase RecT [Caenibius sp. WL]QZP06837.1 recombinase RecT [Caenibius sp. WL]
MNTARSRAIANESAQIEASQSRAIAAREENRRPRNALEAMAQRLNISAAGLKNTLSSTVFSACRSEEEFMALIVVANEYGLNPMLKEIYAFPAKGSGIVPMVSVDGWIRIMNEHPAFDGIEFEYTNDEDGNTEAIESIIYRKDRAHPIKTIEYMDECERNTDPWKKSPRRMLRHRALMQGARIAFGFSGIAAEGDEEELGQVIDITPQQPKSLPTQAQLAAEQGDQAARVDETTGEVFETDERGMSQVDEETARALDAGEQQTYHPDATYTGAKPANAEAGETWFNPDDGNLRYAHQTAHGIKWYLKPQQPSEAEIAEQTAKDIDGPLDDKPAEDAPAWQPHVDRIRNLIADAQDRKALNAADSEFVKISVGLPDDVADQIEGELREARRALAAGNGEG